MVNHRNSFIFSTPNYRPSMFFLANRVLLNYHQAGRIAQYMYYDSKLLPLLSTLLIQFKLDYGLFGESNIHLISAPDKPGKQMYILHKRS